MKYTNRRAFDKHLEGANPAHFAENYLIISKEPAERKEAVDLLTGYLLHGQMNSDLCLKSFDSERISADDLHSELHGLSLLSDKRVVVIHQAEKLPKSISSILEEYFSHPNHSVCLIISASSIHSNTNFYKKAEKAGVILDLAEEKPWEKEKSMKEWILQRAAKMEKKVDAQCAAFLLKQIGCDQSVVYNEFEKLCCYVGERVEITPRDIAAVCTKINLENGWQLGEAIFRRDAKMALRTVHALMEEGTAFLTLLRQLRSQFQTEFQVCSILAGGGTQQDVSQQFPYMRGMILDRHIQNAQSYGMQRFKTGLLQIDEAEMKFKSNALSPEILMEVLIAKLAKK